MSSKLSCLQSYKNSIHNDIRRAICGQRVASIYTHGPCKPVHMDVYRYRSIYAPVLDYIRVSAK